MLLGVGCLLCLSINRLENGLKVRIDHERRHGAILVIVELQLRLFGVWREKHVEHRHEVVAGAELLVTPAAFFIPKMSEAAKADILLFFVVRYIFEQTGDTSDWCVMLLQIM